MEMSGMRTNNLLQCYGSSVELMSGGILDCKNDKVKKGHVFNCSALILSFKSHSKGQWSHLIGCQTSGDLRLLWMYKKHPTADPLDRTPLLAEGARWQVPISAHMDIGPCPRSRLVQNDARICEEQDQPCKSAKVLHWAWSIFGS